MKKITWDFLSVELTRKCQINCKHCFKGKCQNITISKEVIEKFLKQTEAIGFLHFTGGEPTLALEEMDYFLDLLYEYRIPLFYFQIVTNGYEKSEKFVQLIKDYSDMIKLCYPDQEIDMKYYVTVGVSVDRYHTGYNPEIALNYYKEELSGYAKVIPMSDGNIPIKIGNGTALPEAIPRMEREKLDTRVEILSKDTKPMCPHYKAYKLLHEEQVYVVCLFGLNLETMFNNYMHTSSLKECERRVPILRQERKVILDEIDKLYDSYEEIYNKKVKSKEIKNLFVGAFGNKMENMDENFLEWIIGLRN